MADRALPPQVRGAAHEPLGDYWRRRLEQALHDTYAGAPLVKLPEDLRAYEHLIWETRSNVVIELGVHLGGSALWFRDRLEALARYGRFQAEPAYVGIDIDVAQARDLLDLGTHGAAGIQLVEGDVLDPELPERVAELLPPSSRCLVIDDSAHTHATTLAALRGFHRFVPEGGFFVVEDGVVDVESLRIASDWPRGVHRAIDDWMGAEGERAGFRRRPDLERYGVTTNVGGYLERVSASLGSGA